MSSLKSINIFLCVCCYIAFVRAEESCGQQYRVPIWEEDWDNFPPPAVPRIGLVEKCPRALEVQIHNTTEDFTVTLIANPLIKDGKECPNITANNYPEFRKYHKPQSVMKGVSENKSLFFGKIFTGCYYVEMTNIEGKSWLWDPRFLKTDYRYYDTTLKCNFQMKPGEQNLSAQLRYNITVPFTYSKLRCQVFEHQTNRTKDVLDSRIISPIQDCFITYNGNGMVPLVECNWTDGRPQITAGVAVVEGVGWRTIIRMSHLRNHVTFYSVKWEQHIENDNITFIEDPCGDSKQKNNHGISYGDLKAWQSVIKFGALMQDTVNVTNPTPAIVSSGFLDKPFVMIGLYILLAVAIMAILAYWRTKYSKVLFRKNRAANNLLVSLSDVSHDEEGSNHVLLIYAYDSPSVMKAMEGLRRHLKQINLFPVHDLYSDDEFNTIMALGATGWIESLLKDGCKVVWVDTPQLRSVLKKNKSNKGEEKEHKSGDFRDEAVPYAVALAKDLYQDATTQYCRHFVVRLKGLEVEEGNDDPLFVISPHVRYRIPEHLPLLCDHLTKQIT